MKPRKILAALFIFGIIALGFVYSVNKDATDPQQAVDTNINFPLTEED